MKKTPAYVLVMLCIALFSSCKHGNDHPASGGSSPLPYTVQLIEDTNSALPKLHSYTHATYNDKIIMFGGRTSGLHSSNYTFTQARSNKTIYVIDTHNWNDSISKWTVYGVADSLIIFTDTAATSGGNITAPSQFLNGGQFRANNAEFFTKDSLLYVVGGLLGIGGDNPNGPTALPYFTSVNLPTLIKVVTARSQAPQSAIRMPQGAIRQATDPNLAISGGEMGVAGDTVYTIFGWNYGPPFFGLYSHMITTFTYTDNTVRDTLGMQYNQVCATCWDGYLNSSNSGNFRRRDGSVSPIIDPANGNKGFMYYAGVFKNGNTNFDTPVWIYNNSAKEDTNFVLRSNVYTCQVMAAYSKTRQESYATMFGGMRNASYNGGAITAPALLTATNAPITTPDLVNFLSVPFTNQVTTIKTDASRNMTQYLLPDSFPPTIAPVKIHVPAINVDTTYAPGSLTFNGAESEITWTLNDSLTMGNGVINYDAFLRNYPNGGSVGYLHGGILSFRTNLNMNNTTHNQGRFSIASNRIFRIRIIPAAAAPAHKK